MGEVCVIAAGLELSVTIEAGIAGRDEVHLHAAGQGFWVARLVTELGERASLCAPLGGETGAVLEQRLEQGNIRWAGNSIARGTPAYVHDRRSGERTELAHMPAADLDRHELDDWYNLALAAAVTARVCVITGNGPAGCLPADVYGRLTADLRTAGVRTVGDLHGPELHAALRGGGLDLVKVSHEDLILDGMLDDDGHSALVKAVGDLVDLGARGVVLSRATAPTLAFYDGRWFMAGMPRLQVVDHRGSGDAMTGALAVGLLRRLPFEDVLRLASAAGGASVTRRGLASARAPLIETLAHEVTVSVHDEPPTCGLEELLKPGID